jgi:hypothetical protein
MAIIKCGPIVASIRGSIGGVTFSQSRAGPFARGRHKPADTTTNRRDTYRSQMAYIWTCWKNIATQGERDAWETLGQATTFYNALGEHYHPTGYNLFLRSNAILTEATVAIQYTAPATAIADYYPVIYSWGINSWIYGEVPTAPAASTHYLFKLGKPCPPTKTYYRGPYKTSNIADFDSGSTGPKAIFQIYAYLDPTQRSFIVSRTYKITGEVSAKYYQFLEPA